MTTDHTQSADRTRTAAANELRHRFLARRWISTGTARRSRPRNEWGFARFARRSPGAAAWCLVLMFAGTRAWTRDPFPQSLDRDRAAREAQWIATAQSFVYESLDVIGHRVRVNGVDVTPLGGILGLYDPHTATISIDLNLWTNEKEVLSTAAHESVHALFHRIKEVKDWRSTPPYQQLVEETAAAVLGAYIAGRVWEQRGHDGEALTRRLISKHRDFCDPTKPHSLYQEIAAGQAEKGQQAFSPGVEWSAHIHFGSTTLVDEIDEICRAHPGPWEAA